MSRLKTARQKVVEHLNNAGYAVNEEDIKIIRGPKAKEDILQCWFAYCPTSKHRSAEITSMHTLTELQHGITVRPMTEDDLIYGDFLVEPKLCPQP